ncbi:MAG: prolyl-tRNA synthetase associated domain-containing protein [Rhodospirillales bacterium]|nr:prolyl-tRNA synthetase associated domain-containing protein [Rhodospirillales bacterium]MBO6787662.1 prolyl-tRNA synthetase associated domain-containing protein [Rhodospirillales bacterium]
MHTKESLLEHLKHLGIESRTVTHPPVYTVDEAKAHRDDMPGGHTKNLFLKDKKGRMFLVTADEDRPVDLKALREKLGSKPLSFASADRLMANLGVEPGSVTPLAMINDEAGAVTMAIDGALLEHDLINVHPLVNTATTAMTPGDLIRFLEASGHAPLVIDF